MENSTATHTLLITKKVQIINWKEFAKTSLNLNIKVFVIYIGSGTLEIFIHLVLKVWIALLKIKKSTLTVSFEYSNFAGIFSKKLAAMLSKYTKIKIYTIDLEKDKQLSSRLIYNLGPVELKTLKTYIVTNLTNSFI